MERGLSGKAAVVTGASLGFGAAIAMELARDGARVNASNPGLIAFNWFRRDAKRTIRGRSGSRGEALRHWLSSHAAAQADRPGEIGSLTANPAPAKADFIQNRINDIDGGPTRSF